jgi:hypothetical protein
MHIECVVIEYNVVLRRTAPGEDRRVSSGKAALSAVMGGKGIRRPKSKKAAHLAAAAFCDEDHYLERARRIERPTLTLAIFPEAISGTPIVYARVR